MLGMHGVRSTNYILQADLLMLGAFDDRAIGKTEQFCQMPVFMSISIAQSWVKSSSRVAIRAVINIRLNRRMRLLGLALRGPIDLMNEHGIRRLSL